MARGFLDRLSKRLTGFQHFARRGIGVVVSCFPKRGKRFSRKAENLWCGREKPIPQTGKATPEWIVTSFSRRRFACSNRKIDWTKRIHDWTNRKIDWTSRIHDWTNRKIDWTSRIHDWTNRKIACTRRFHA